MLGGLSATVTLELADLGSLPSPAFLSFEGRPHAMLSFHPGV